MGIITGRAPPRSSGNKPSPRRAKFKGLASQREYGAERIAWLFYGYGCSYRCHLSSNDRRHSYFTGS